MVTPPDETDELWTTLLGVLSVSAMPCQDKGAGMPFPAEICEYDQFHLGSDTLALDKLLGDGPELLGMFCGESIRHIAGEG